MKATIISVPMTNRKECPYAMVSKNYPAQIKDYYCIQERLVHLKKNNHPYDFLEPFPFDCLMQDTYELQIRKVQNILMELIASNRSTRCNSMSKIRSTAMED